MRVGDVDLRERILIVAEIGNNHEGQFGVAQELVRQAAACGVDAVKFQTFRTERYLSRGDAPRFNRLKSFELTTSQFSTLSELAHSLGLLFLSTPLDLESVAVLEGLVEAYKIASGDNNFYPLLDAVCHTGKPVIISAGLSGLEQIVRSKQFVEARWNAYQIHQELAVLHCVSSYPVPPEQVNLAAIRTLRDSLRCPIGYSDHTVGIEACKVAVAIGARIIEKHFTLDTRYSDFRDHHLSADPPEMTQLVQEVRQVQRLLGRPDKVIQACEAPNAQIIRRSIAAATDLSAGHQLVWQDLMWIRPAIGLPPGEERQLLGRTLRRAVAFGEAIQLADVD